MQHSDLMWYLADAANFSTFFAGSPAAKSTPHLYISALSTWYQQSPVWTHWKHQFAFIPSILLRHAITVPLMTMTANAGINCIELSRNGDLIVSGSQDDLVQVWDAKTGEQLKLLQGHTNWVNSVAFSPDSSQIVSGSGDHSVRMWDVKTGEQLRELQGHTGIVFSVIFSPDGNQIVSGSFDQSVRVWDAKTGEQLRKLQGHTGIVNSVAFSPDNNQIISGSSDHLVCVCIRKVQDLLKIYLMFAYHTYCPLS